MKTLPKMKISDELDAQLVEAMKVSQLRKADVVRGVLGIRLPQFAASFRPTSRWMERRIHEALTEPAEATTPAQFKKNMQAVAQSR